MNPRLAALLRQRDILREHANWLDGEITREQGLHQTSPPTADPDHTAPVQSTSAQAIPPAQVPEPNIKELHSEVRQGCMMYFLIAAGLLGGLIGFIYWRY